MLIMAHYAEAPTLSSTLSITLSFAYAIGDKGQSDGQSGGQSGPRRIMRIAVGRQGLRTDNSTTLTRGLGQADGGHGGAEHDAPASACPGSRLLFSFRAIRGQLLAGGFGHLHLGGADVLDLDGRRAVHIAVFAIEVDCASQVEFVLREHAVLHPELD
jgi:hypothetical protein